MRPLYVHARLVQVETLLLGNNQLSGPAFPPAWRGRGAFPVLKRLSLKGNRRLVGTLPASLAWPQVAIM